MIWAVILAAGESRRMGRQKLLLPFRGRTVIGSVVEAALASRADRTLVVLGSHEREIRESLRGRQVEFVVNENFRLGMLSSIQAAFQSLPVQAEAAIIMLGDQPAIPVEVINGLISSFRKTRKKIIVPAYKGKRGHPLLITAGLKDDVLALAPAVGLRGLKTDRPGDVAEVEMSYPEILRDLDTPKDYGLEVRKRKKE